MYGILIGFILGMIGSLFVNIVLNPYILKYSKIYDAIDILNDDNFDSDNEYFYESHKFDNTLYGYNSIPGICSKLPENSIDLKNSIDMINNSYTNADIISKTKIFDYEDNFTTKKIILKKICYYEALYRTIYGIFIENVITFRESMEENIIPSMKVHYNKCIFSTIKSTIINLRNHCYVLNITEDELNKIFINFEKMTDNENDYFSYIAEMNNIIIEIMGMSICDIYEHLEKSKNKKISKKYLFWRLFVSDKITTFKYYLPLFKYH